MTGTAAGGIVVVGAIAMYGLGVLMSFAGAIWLLVRAFQTSLVWGLVVFFLPFANIVFAIKHWAFAKKPFLLSLVGVAILLVAGLVGFVAGVGFFHPGGSRGENTEIRSQVADDLDLSRQKAVPLSDREKVAELLATAGINPENPRTFQGRTIAEMTAALGTPSANMKVKGKHLYIFQNCFEVESKDGGKTVSGVHYMGQ